MYVILHMYLNVDGVIFVDGYLILQMYLWLLLMVVADICMFYKLINVVIISCNVVKFTFFKHVLVMVNSWKHRIKPW